MGRPRGNRHHPGLWAHVAIARMGCKLPCASEELPRARPGPSSSCQRWRSARVSLGGEKVTEEASPQVLMAGTKPEQACEVDRRVTESGPYPLASTPGCLPVSSQIPLGQSLQSLHPFGSVMPTSYRNVVEKAPLLRTRSGAGVCFGSHGFWISARDEEPYPAQDLPLVAKSSFSSGYTDKFHPLGTYPVLGPVPREPVYAEIPPMPRPLSVLPTRWWGRPASPAPREGDRVSQRT